MDSRAEEFRELVAGILRRYADQNAHAPLADAKIAALAARLWALVAGRGLPPSLPPGELGTPGEMSEAECAPLVARVWDDAEDPFFLEPVRQLVKACFYPEFKVCRDSYRAETPQGVCRRQELPRATKRISGSHCVDCPYWQSLEPAAHARMLTAAWQGDAADFAAHASVFLPEDFRALRRWVRAQAAG